MEAQTKSVSDADQASVRNPYRMYWRDADVERRWEKQTSDPIEAEEWYFISIRNRTPGDIWAVIESDLPEVVAPAEFKLQESDFSASPRERVHLRSKQILYHPGQSGTGPSVWQLRGLAKAAKLSGTAAGTLAGKDGRSWRYWTTEGDTHRQIPWASWFALLVLSGHHPQFLIQSPVARGAPHFSLMGHNFYREIVELGDEGDSPESGV